jgi:hypothetical protein
MKRIIFLCILLVLGLCSLRAEQNRKYQFISPKPGSDYNTRESTIIIREGTFLDPASLLEQNLLHVVGSQSGEINGQKILSTDGKTLIFKPDRFFSPGELVTVEVSDNLLSIDGDKIPGTVFSFRVSPFVQTPNPYELIPELKPNYREDEIAALNKVVQDTLPANFPTVTTTIYDTAALGEGYVFLAVAAEVSGLGYYLMIIDNYGTPVWYKELAHDYAYDFKVQPNGLMTYGQFIEHHSYTGGGDVIHMVMDTSFTVIDSIQMKHGYVAEGHDFQILPNGHVLMFGYYLTQVDMSQYVDGGYPDALISGGIIQEHDTQGNVIFQWRSWDYYDFADYPWGRRSNQPIVSAFHLNTINLDFDGNIFLATPLWVKKISRQTGEILWHLGDYENEFSFVGVDSLTGLDHFGGHAFNRIPNGNVLIYDNGNRPGTRSSQVHEYTLDQPNLIATHIWTYVPPEVIPAWHRGNAQRLSNGNTVIGWGGASASARPIPTCTEINAAGNKVFEVYFDHLDMESYRAFRFPLPNINKPVTVTIYEVANGNTYEFAEGDSIDTGVSLEIITQEPGGYNEIRVERWPYAPLYPEWPGKAPRVEPVRVYLSGSNITSINANISFNAESFGLSNPDTLIVYHRQFPGNGLFIPLTTTYNPVTKKITASMDRFGEFIFAIPDLNEIAYPPILSSPTTGDTLVNQNLPVSFEWTPRGLFNTSQIQVATDPDFNSIMVNDSGLTECIHMLAEANEDTKYYWRVRIKNQAGISDWSEDWFKTSAPVIEINTPNGGEEWQRGLSYFLRWNDNIHEDVIIELRKGESSYAVIDTTESNGAYEWDIDPQLETGTDYFIKIRSLETDLLFDLSNSSFSVIDTVTSNVSDKINRVNSFSLLQNYPNPFNPSTKILFTLPKQEQVTLEVFSMLGQKVRTLIDKNMPAGVHEVEFDASWLPSGIYLYRIQAGRFSEVKKMVLIR